MNCRLLYVIGELHTGGSERQLCYLLRAMDRERYKPAVAVWNYSERDIHVPLIRGLDVPIFPLPQVRARAAKLRALRTLVRQLQPEVVHSWSFYTNFAAYWTAWGTGAVSVGSVRSDFLRAVRECGTVLGRLSARWPSNQICNNLSAAQTVRGLRSRFFVPGKPTVVPNAIDLDQFCAFPIPTQPPVRMLGIGYLIPVKRWEWLLIAVHQLKERGISCLVQIAGDGPLRSDLQQRAEDLGLSGCVQFLGHIDDVPGLLADAAFVVHTADSEGCPNAVMEAMACGRAVIAADAGDISSLIEHGKTGFVVRRGDTAALVTCMERLISEPGLCRTMGEAARARAERTFDLDGLVRKTFEVYRASGWRDAQTP
jgi:glycosyltransferase involved in cell wall biosynthesis